MQEEIELEKLKKFLNEQLNNENTLTEEQLKEQLEFIIKQYEMEFYNNFTEIFIYTYYQNLLNGTNSPMDQIINFTQNRKFLDNTGKEDVVKAERKACENVIKLYNLYVSPLDNEQSYTSFATNLKIPLNYQAHQIIDNKDIFFRPPVGDPKLRGPHVNYTVEYSVNYWQEFKNQIEKYITDFENSHSKEFLEDLKDYQKWSKLYDSLIYYINITKIYNENKGEAHVKN